jgi:guanylate kinase
MHWYKKLIFVLTLLAVPIGSFAELCPQVFNQAPAVRSEGKPHLITFSAPSGTGKTTLANLILQDFPNLVKSISSTTRAPRGTEKDGVEYHFLTQAEFEKKIKEGKFAEYALVHGNYYGTEIASIRKSFDAGKSVLADVDVTGAKNLRASFPNEIFTIFINPPDMATLEKRLRGRGTDAEDVIQKRLGNAAKEMVAGKDSDRVIINDELERAHAEIRALLEQLHLVPASLKH